MTTDDEDAADQMSTALERPAASQRRPPLNGPHGPVPYVTTWSDEAALPMPLVSTPNGIAYADELLIDRDGRGVLWLRAPSRPGLGEPLYSVVHPLRLRRVMRRLLCQVCAGPADHNAQGTLWVLPVDDTFDWSEWPKRLITTHAPVCPRHARMSVKACPALRKRHLVVRAHSTIIGVSGDLYGPDYPAPRVVRTNVLARYGAPAIRWTQATHLVREPRDCELVTL